MFAIYENMGHLIHDTGFVRPSRVAHTAKVYDYLNGTRTKYDNMSSQYSPLPSKENLFYMRLFLLRKGNARDPIHFKLTTEELSPGNDCTGPLRYEALSYTWGDEREMRSIYYDQDLTFPVRLNLHDALLELRLPE
jgi:hypothetical protein